MKHILYREQQLNCTLTEAWFFFSSPHNLSKITPPEMKFHILSDQNYGPITEGLLINYTVSPFLNIPLKWRTKITHVEQHQSFIDLQEKGPYKHWSHLHEFIANDHGVLMKDTVVYELPLGILGTLAHRLFVKKKLTHIFSYRYHILKEYFNMNKH